MTENARLRAENRFLRELVRDMFERCVLGDCAECGMNVCGECLLCVPDRVLAAMMGGMR